jgi:hypothetical protein
MKSSTALVVALALAPAALGSAEFPAWRTARSPPGFVGTARLPLSGAAAQPRASCGLRMQAQSATHDPPRFNDLKTLLSGVVTRAERQAMMVTTRAARLSPPMAPATVPGLRDASWETEEVGHGVRCRKHCALALFGRAPTIHRAVDQIHQATLEAVAHPECVQELVFSAEEVSEVRQVAHSTYVEGQRTMTKLGQMLAARIMSSGYECRSMVTGESGADTEEFRISQEVPLALLLENLGSLDFAQQQLSGLVVQAAGSSDWTQTAMIDHSVEFEAQTANDMGVAKVLVHARPSSQLWRFISDSVFDIDYAEMGAVDDDDNHDSMYEIKILVESQVQAELLHRDMRTLNFKDSELSELHVPISEASRTAKLISQINSKRKSKVVWQGVGMSIQVQTLDEHYIETELSSMTARAREQALREDVCQELERRVSLFKFSRDLLHWLFASTSMRHPPTSDRIAVKLHQ